MSDVSTIATALAGPAGAMVLLAVVLFGVWKFLNRGLELLSTHLTRIETKFDEGSKAINTLTDTIRPLAIDIESVARQNDIRRPRQSPRKEAQ